MLRRTALVLVLDEPILGLAPVVVKEVFQKVAEVCERLGTTITVADYKTKGVLDIVDRAYVRNRGRVVKNGTPQSVQETDILTQAFLGKVDADDLAEQDLGASPRAMTHRCELE